MKIKVKQQGEVKIISLIGDLDATTANQIKKEILSHVESDSKLILDMQKCEYISSAGLRVLLIIAKKLKKKGGQGVLAGLLEEVEDIIEMTGFDHMFKSYDNIQKAINSFSKGD